MKSIELKKLSETVDQGLEAMIAELEQPATADADRMGSFAAGTKPTTKYGAKPA
jgi:hypothetical protein